MQTINVGIIGIGKMGILHGGILCSLDGVTVQAIADSETRLHKFVRTILPGLRVYKDYREMLDNEKLDLVYITTPTLLHPVIAEVCVDKGINFFVEKPLGNSSKECAALVNKIRQAPVINMVGYCNHFADTFRKAKEIIDSRILSDLFYLNSCMYLSQMLSERIGSRRKESMTGGGVLNVLATHLVDLLLWLFGDISQVQGSIRSYYLKGVEDFAHSYLVFNSGLEGYLDTSWSVRGYRLPEIKIEVEGKKGKLIVTDDFVRFYLDETARWETYYKQDLYRGVDIDIGGPEYSREDKHLVESIVNGRNTDLDVLYAHKVQRVIDAIYESALNNTPIEIHPYEVENDSD